MVSQMSVPAPNRITMPGLRLDPRVLSAGASASDRRVQVEPAHGPDTAVHRLWFFGIYAQCDYGKTSASFYSHAVSLGLVRAARFLLGIPQHALVPIRLVAARY